MPALTNIAIFLKANPNDSLIKDVAGTDNTITGPWVKELLARHKNNGDAGWPQAFKAAEELEAASNRVSITSSKSQAEAKDKTVQCGEALKGLEVKRENMADAKLLVCLCKGLYERAKNNDAATRWGPKWREENYRPFNEAADFLQGKIKDKELELSRPETPTPLEPASPTVVDPEESSKKVSSIRRVSESKSEIKTEATTTALFQQLHVDTRSPPPQKAQITEPVPGSVAPAEPPKQQVQEQPQYLQEFSNRVAGICEMMRGTLTSYLAEKDHTESRKKIAQEVWVSLGTLKDNLYNPQAKPMTKEQAIDQVKPVIEKLHDKMGDLATLRLTGRTGELSPVLVKTHGMITAEVSRLKIASEVAETVDSSKATTPRR